MARRALAAAVLGAAALAAASAHAGKKECAQAYVEAQKLMKAGQLKKAREQLDICAHDECLAAVRKDCVAWLDQVNASIPSIVVQAKAADGKDTVDVKLSIDGAPVADHLDVKAIELEPGTHKVRFEMAGEEPIEQDVILHQGERNRVVSATFGAKGQPEDKGVAPAQPASHDEGVTVSPEKPPSRVMPLVFGGVALAAIAGAGVFWYRAESARGDLDGCAPLCSQDDVSAVKRDRLIGDVLLGVGVVSAGLAVYFLVTSKPARRSTALEWIGPGVRF
jgi:hypothetical protein